MACPPGTTTWAGCFDGSGCLPACTTTQTIVPSLLNYVPNACPSAPGEIIASSNSNYYFIRADYTNVQCIPSTITVNFRPGISCAGSGPFTIRWLYGSQDDLSSLSISYSNPQCSCNAPLQNPQSFLFTPTTLPSYQVQSGGILYFFQYDNTGIPGSGLFYLDGSGASTDYVTIVFAP